MLANLYSFNKHVVDNIEQKLGLLDEVEVPLLPLVREGKLDEVLLVFLILSYHPVYLLDYSRLEENQSRRDNDSSDNHEIFLLQLLLVNLELICQKRVLFQ